MFQCGDGFLDCHGHICGSKSLWPDYVNDATRVYVTANLGLEVVRQVIAGAASSVVVLVKRKEKQKGWIGRKGRAEKLGLNR